MSLPLGTPDRANAGMHMAWAARTELYRRLNQRDVLIVTADCQEPLVVLRLSLAAEIASLGASTMCIGKALRHVVPEGNAGTEETA